MVEVERLAAEVERVGLLGAGRDDRVDDDLVADVGLQDRGFGSPKADEKP